MKTRFRSAASMAWGVAGFVLVCHMSPGFARAALKGISLPAMAGLHRLTAALAFPAAEILVVILASALILALAAAMVRSVAERSGTPLIRWLAGFTVAALALGGALALLWAPARALPADALPGPDDDQLAWLCEALIDGLNASGTPFPEAEESLRAAPGVAGMAGCAVKAARYPEWMRAAHISGFFLPLTGEALVDAGAPGPLVPFTAVHELMHLAGVADEGEANIAAWRRCMDAGGAFADSARLWALRYALGQLRLRDADARERVEKKMEGPLTRTFRMCGGEIVPAKRRNPSLPWLSLNCGDYAALVGYLASSPPG